MTNEERAIPPPAAVAVASDVTGTWKLLGIGGYRWSATLGYPVGS
jgi:hypothetical protein